MTLSALFTEYVRTGFGDLNEAEMPKWSIGDTWKFNVDYKEEIGLLGTVTFEVTSDSREVTQFGTSHVCYELNITGGGTVYGQLYEEGITGTWTMNGKEYCQKSDMSWVKSTVTTDATFTYATESMAMTQIVETSYNPPLDANKGFPLTVGESWAAATTETTTTEMTIDGSVDTSTDTSTYTKNYFVLRSELTTVSAGEFDTFVIKRTDPEGSHAEYYFSPEAGSDVKLKEYSAVGELQVTMELLEYSYAAAKEEFSWLSIIVGSVIAAAVVASGVAYILYKRRKTPVPSAPPTTPTEQPPEPIPP